MFAWAIDRKVRIPPLGFYVLAFEIFCFIAATVALQSERFIAPLALIFFALDHTEFLIFVVAAICGSDYFVTRTPARAVIFAIALIPLVILLIAIVARVMAPEPSWHYSRGSE